ncbi:uncharacterized protein LOC121727699 [Aricia agestis]|uniref:uncharacterized protein LOC121727699 n=1 Tax=Aricia agestis TaxID=91739 RepID=UPI001C20BD6F|nr:uncharacterized protein LOC121727699 [Aricia agestis]
MYALLSAYVHTEGKIMSVIIRIAILSYLFAINVLISTGCPHEAENSKAVYKTGGIADLNQPITLATIKRKLNDSGVFDADNVSLTATEQKELAKLFEAIEIMATTRNRQPSAAQNAYSSLRLVERAVKKSLKEGQISESLAGKFDWDKLSDISKRQRRDKPAYYLNTTTNMRVFNTE